MSKVQERIDIDAIVNECGLTYGGELSGKEYAENFNAVLNALSKEVFNSIEGVKDSFLILQSLRATDYSYNGEYVRISVCITGPTITYHLVLSHSERLIDERRVSYYDPLAVGLDNDRQLFNKYVTDLRYLLELCSSLTDYAEGDIREEILAPRQYIAH